MPYNYYQNEDCEYLPCHVTGNTENFSCQFCFCPLYYMNNCGGNYKDFNGIKDCGDCLIPHENYKYIYWY